MRSLPKPGRPRRAKALALAAALLLPVCNYGFQGGGGFPSHIRTVFIEPFENQTDRFDLENVIFTQLLEELPRALGVRPGGRDVADAIVRGRVIRYEDGPLSYSTGNLDRPVEIHRNQVQITIAVEIIDRRRNVVLWESSGVTGIGEYETSAQNDDVARNQAVKNLVQRIIEGAQSQW